VSQIPYNDFNLSTNVGDEVNAVLENRARLRNGLQIPNEPFWLNQAHTKNIALADTNTTYPTADAAYTIKPHIVCVVLTADCLPILLCSKQGDLVVAIHAGWRGIINGVIEAALNALPINPSSLLAWFGPAIGSKAFVVGDDVREQFVNQDAKAQAAFVKLSDNQWLCDIYLIGRQRLNNCGITAICGGEFCTYSDPEKFFSFRCNARTGRQATLIWFG
jgi:YfiH family protein